MVRGKRGLWETGGGVGVNGGEVGDRMGGRLGVNLGEGGGVDWVKNGGRLG